MQGITGKLSGKLGSAVFRVRDGAQVVAQYNPVVKNPNSEGQQSSRAAFKLMSQLAAVMSPGFGTMSVTKRGGRGTPSKRNEFFKLNYGLVSTEDTAQGIVASVPMEQLQLTNSFREFGSMNVTQTGEGTITVTMSAAGAGHKGGKVVLVGYGSMSVTKSPRVIDIADYDYVGGSKTIQFTDLPEGDYTVLAYGYIASDELLAKTSLDNLHTPEDESYIGQVNLEKALADGSIVCTMTTGANVNVEHSSAL